jgi:hypothetical protein
MMVENTWRLPRNDELPGSYELPEQLQENPGGATEHEMGESHEWNGLSVTVSQVKESEGQYADSYSVPVTVENTSGEVKPFDPWIDLYPYAGGEPIMEASPDGGISSITELQPGETVEGSYEITYTGAEQPRLWWEPYNQGATLRVAVWNLTL